MKATYWRNNVHLAVGNEAREVLRAKHKVVLHATDILDLVRGRLGEAPSFIGDLAKRYHPDAVCALVGQLPENGAVKMVVSENDWKDGAEINWIVDALRPGVMDSKSIKALLDNAREKGRKQALSAAFTAIENALGDDHVTAEKITSAAEQLLVERGHTPAPVEV